MAYNEDGNGEVELEPEAERKLFIGGVSFKTSDESLKEFYSQWGEITDVVVIKDKHTNRSKGFGYVTYKHSSMVDEAMSNRPHRIDDRQVQPKRAVPREETNAASQLSVKKIFIGGLKDKPITEDDIKEYFSQYGTITDCVLMKDKETGASRGFAFVEYDDHDPVDRMMLKKMVHRINDCPLDVKKAIPKEAEMGGGGRGGGRGGFGGGMGRGGFGGGFGGSRGGMSMGYGGGYGMGGGGGMGRGGSWGNGPAYGMRGGGYDGGYGGGYNDFGQSWGQSYGGGPMRGFGGGRPGGPYGGGGRW